VTARLRAGDFAVVGSMERLWRAAAADVETVETFASQTRAARPLEQRLRDSQRLQQAVEAAIGPFADPSAGR
jgi:hypothetical protein